MTGKKTISRWQLFCLGFLCLLSPIIRTLPRQTALFAGSYAWLSALIALVPLSLLLLLSRRFFKNAAPNEGFAELFIRALGKWAGKVAILIYTIWFIFYAALTLRSGADRYVASAYQHSTPTFFIVLLLLLGIVAALGPLRSFSRTAEVFFPLVAIVLALIFGFSFRDVDFLYLPRPTLGQAENILSGVPSVAAVLGMLVLYFGFLEGRVREKSMHTRINFTALLSAALMVLLLCVTTVGVFSAGLVSRASFPFFMMVSNLTLFRGLDRLEPLILALWVVMDFVLFTALLYVISNNLRICFGFPPASAERARMFDFRNGRWIIWLASAAAAVPALCFVPNSFMLSHISSYVVPFGNLALVFGLLPLIIIIGVIRRRV